MSMKKTLNHVKGIVKLSKTYAMHGKMKSTSHKIYIKPRVYMKTIHLSKLIKITI